MIQLEAVQLKKERRLAIVWSVTFLIVFPLLITLGLLMRLNQGEIIKLPINDFYALMTLHGLGMVGVLFSIAFAGLWYLISTRYRRLNIRVGYFTYCVVLIGFLGLAFATLIGGFAPGWYLLYPLPFKGATWTIWATRLSIISLIIMGIGWLVGILHLLYGLAKEYGGFTKLLGWQYLGKKKVDRELPPIVMISTVSLVPGVFALLAAAVFLIMYLLQSFEPALSFNVLLMKNITMFFGHTLANIIIYSALGWVYALLPEFTGREWKTNKVVMYSWNATFLFILFAFFHHMYMDFAQPIGMQYAGQVISYLSAVPATVVTMFGVITQLYHSKVKWGIVPLTFLIGTAGWAIGGGAAVVDSTIAMNRVLHNTLWVPAHFHTYLLLGAVLFIFGFLFYLFSENGNQDGGKLAKTGFWLFVLGGHGFLATFYFGGLSSIPRRYADYSGIEIKSVHQMGEHLAQISVWLIALLVIGLFIMYFSLFAKLFSRRIPSARFDVNE